MNKTFDRKPEYLLKDWLSSEGEEESFLIRSQSILSIKIFN